MTKNEGVTRKKLIDPMLLHVGWNVANPVRVEIEVPVDGYDAEPWNDITDYVLHDDAARIRYQGEFGSRS